MRLSRLARRLGNGVATVAMMLVAADATTSSQTDVVPPTSSATSGPAGAPVPAAWDYLRLTPEARYALRTKARALPPAERAEHDRALRTEIHKLPAWIYEALYEERSAMDCKVGTFAPMPPAGPVEDGWAWVKRPPHQRYELRRRARALGEAEKREYDAQFAREMAKLPPWLQAALNEEAERLDARYGTSPCP